MVTKPAFQKKDADKGREELLEELEALRGYYSRLKAVVGRYERAVGKKDVFRSLYELEARKDSVEALRSELREKQKEIDLQNEELEVQNEELRAKLEELQLYREQQSRTEEIRDSDASLRRFATVVMDSNDAVTLFDLDGNIQAWNRGACDTYGYSEEEALAMNILSIVPEDERHNAEAMMTRLRMGELVKSFETRRRTKDGRVLDVWLTVTAIRDENGKIYAIATTERDITERIRSEEELRVMNQTLERLVAERTASLNDAKSQAELYLDLMGHDINNLLQIALGYLEMAKDLPPGEKKDEFLDKPVEVLQQSSHLIKNVRKLQKFHDGKFQTGPVDVCKVLAGVQREYGDIPNKAVTLNVNGLGSCHVRANELLHDVFANLVGNAVKHTGDRAGIIIDLDVMNDGGGRYCRVMVEDDGPGIPDDIKPKLFNRLHKGNNHANGMGLGLYIVRSLVDSYGGRVWVEDRVKGDHTKGARFVVLLPAAEME